MAKSHRELKKPAQPIPPIPDLGKLHKPRKGNRKAALRIASGVRLWDQRHIDRVKRRRALREQETKAATDAYFRALEKLTKAVLAEAPSWKGILELRPVADDAVDVDELFEAFRSAVARDDFEPAGGREVLRLLVYGLTFREQIALRAMLPSTINTVYGHHMRAHTDENQADFQLRDYDPRVSGPLEG